MDHSLYAINVDIAHTETILLICVDWKTGSFVSLILPDAPPRSLEIFFGGVAIYTWINDQAGYLNHLFMITLPKPLPERRHDIAISPPHCIFSQTTRSRLNRLCQLPTRRPCFEHEPEKNPNELPLLAENEPIRE